MTGGLLQLVGYGAQDIYLTGNPQMTFFKTVFRRYSNFAMESIEQQYVGKLEAGGHITCTVARSGDLIGPIYLVFELSSNVVEQIDPSMPYRSINHLGYKMIDYVEVEIGGQLIDRHYGVWMNIWSQLTSNVSQYTKIQRMTNGVLKTDNPDVGRVYVPLQFWFNCDPGLYLPLIALEHHEVKIHIYLSKGRQYLFYDTVLDEISGTIVTFRDLKIWVDYMFLDTDERQRFTQNSHEYLIEQVQEQREYVEFFSNEQKVVRTNLQFNHPCKEIVWTVLSQGLLNFNAYDAFVYGTDDIVTDKVRSAKVIINGVDRFNTRSGEYFRCVQPYQFHTGAYLQNNPSDGFLKEYGGFYVYSFSLQPEAQQPSGTCNFSRLDSAVIEMDVLTGSNEFGDTQTAFIYARNYNVLRLMGGMAGLAYST